jgi:tetratricopeptide (TPR) repeat protein
MKHKPILLISIHLALIGSEAARSQVLPAGNTEPAVRQAVKPTAANTYVIRHHGGFDNHRPFPVMAAPNPAVYKAGPAEVAASDAFLEQGEAEMKKGYLSAARSDYEQALSLWPESKNALYDAAECAAAAADYPHALAYYRTAIYSGDPSVYGTVPGDGFQENDVSRLMQFASVSSRAGQVSEALFVYNRAAHLLDYEDSQYHGGKPFLKVLLPELAAEPTSPEQVPYTPERLQALADTALAHGEMGFGSLKEATAHMKEAVKLYPDSAVAHYYLGEVLPSRTPEQKAAYQKAAELGDERTAAAAKERLAVLR